MSSYPPTPDPDPDRNRLGDSAGAGDEQRARDTAPPNLFGTQATERGSARLLPWGIAGLTILLILGGLLLASRRGPATPANAILSVDAYAANVVISDLKMSESTSLSGGKSTFIDGHIRNIGPRTVSSATVQVLFANDEGLTPQVETLPLTVIRTREPYVDTQPLNVAPLRPGEAREFRLIFESIGSNWNQQLPEIHLIHISTR